MKYKTFPINIILLLFISCLMASSYTVTDVVWKDLVGVSASGNNLLKTGTYGWNADAISTKTIAEQQDAYVEMTAQETDKSRMLGFADSNDSSHYDTLDYAIYLYSNSYSYIYENGSQIRGIGTYSTGEVFRIERIGSAINYIKDGSIVYTSSVASITSLIIDTSLYTPGATLHNVVLGVANIPEPINFVLLFIGIAIFSAKKLCKN